VELAATTSAHRRRVVRIGVAGAVLVFMALAALHALTIPLLQPQDEQSHVGYALLLSRGRLPTVDSPIPGHELPRLERRLDRSRAVNRTVWTANHPPLFYALIAVPVRIGVLTRHGDGGLYAARLLSVAFAALGVVASAALAHRLVPARPEAAIAAAGLVATTQVLVRTSAVIYTDALLFLAASATLALAALVLVDGPSRGRLLWLTVAACAAAATRISGLLLVGVAAAAAAAAVWLHDRRPVAARLLRAVAAAALVAVAAAAVSAWFYLRNRALYGSFSGAGELLARFTRVERGSLVHVLATPGYWSTQLQRFFDGSVVLPGARGTSRFWLLAAVPAAGLALAGLRWLSRRSRPRPGTLLAWLACLGLLVAVVLTAADFARQGGSAHSRYLLPALAVLAAASAAGLAVLPGGGRAFPAIGMLLALVVVNLTVWYRFTALIVRPPRGEDAIAYALSAAGVPGWLLIPAGVALGAGVAAQVWALRAATAPDRAVVGQLRIMELDAGRPRAGRLDVAERE
jgi:hypothetical protein